MARKDSREINNHHRNFRIELKAPLDPDKIESFYEKIRNLIARTGRVSIASKPYGQFASGFDLSYNFASYLLEQNPQLDILYHVTCYDLNKANIRARLAALKQLKIKRLLVISGDGYEPTGESRVLALQYANSHELVMCILQEYNWFESIAVAAYPDGNGLSSRNNEQECRRLFGVLQAGVSEVYTQCVFEPTMVVVLDRMIRSQFPRVRMIPSVALFANSVDMAKIARLTRVSGPKFHELMTQLEQLDGQEARRFSNELLVALCKRLASDFDLIDLCTFGQFDLADSLLDQVARS